MPTLLSHGSLRLCSALLVLAPLALFRGAGHASLQTEEGTQARGEVTPGQVTPGQVAQDLSARRQVPRGLPATLAETLAADSPALRELGARLFAERLLSLDRSLACASCHVPELGHTDGKRFSAGLGGVPTERNSPTLFNRALGRSFFWDGRAESLEQQVLQPIASPREMGLGIDAAVARLAEHAEYLELFRRATGRAPDAAGVARALAAHVRGLLLGDSPVDRFRHGDRGALNELERVGLWVYESRGRCWRCHGGANFTDEQFHNTGVAAVERREAESASNHGRATGGPTDPPVWIGRAAVTHVAADQGRFKTPTLRGVALTAPYMHDGSLATLDDVVEFYRRGGNPDPNLDPRLAPLDLTDREAAALVAFLRALSRVAEGPVRVEAE